MDSDSPATARIAGQPTFSLGASFTAGNTRKFVPRTARSTVGVDSVRRHRGYRGSPASRRLRPGQGHRP